MEASGGREKMEGRGYKRGRVKYFKMQAICYKFITYITGVGNRRLGVQVHLSESAVAQSYQLEENIICVGFLDRL